MRVIDCCYFKVVPNFQVSNSPKLEGLGVVGIGLRFKVLLKALHHCTGYCRIYEVFLNFRVSNSPPLEGLGVVGILLRF